MGGGGAEGGDGADLSTARRPLDLLKLNEL